MSEQFTTEEVNTLIRERLARDRRQRANELAGLKMQIARYSSENIALRDRIAILELDAITKGQSND